MAMVRMLQTTPDFDDQTNNHWFSCVSTRPLLSLTFLLLLPSFMTIITLVIHRFRQARQERRERAPESVVASLPTGTWSGEGVVFEGVGGEKDGDEHHDLSAEGEDEATSDARTHPVTIPSQAVIGEGEASTSSSPATHASPSIEASDAHGAPTRRRVRLPPSLLRLASSLSETLSNTPPTSDVIPSPAPKTPTNPGRFLRKAWFASQTECAICLGEFEKGDKLRILPCGHVFHLEEVDVWLVRRKRLVSEGPFYHHRILLINDRS